MKRKALKVFLQGFSLLVFLVLIVSCASAPSWQGEGTNTPPNQGQAALAKAVPVRVIGEAELGSTRLNRPTGLALDQAGNLYIIDTGNNRIVKCNLGGEFVKETGGFGWDNGEFNLPSYANLDNGVSLFVSDTQNKRVQRFDNFLNFIQQVGTSIQDQPFSNSQLEGVAVSRNGEVYLADSGNDCVWKLNNAFTSAEKMGGFEAGTGALVDPKGLAIDSRGYLYVADSGNDRIAVFDLFGNFFRSLGRGELNRPSGVDVTRNGEVYVANTYEDDIAVLDGNGTLLFKFGKTGNGQGELSRPTDLKVFEGKTVFVVDSGNNRVQEFEIIH
ncbi:MAG TPA: NHL repeat-containing protein [Terriglobales bacterium]|nr:NHL repeat-containing protein [Terriglobales bacterium]